MGSIHSNPHALAGFSSLANNQKLFLMSPPLSKSSAQATPYRPGPLSHFWHGSYLACYVFSDSNILSLFSCLGFLHPCSVNSDTRAAVLLPNPRLLCSQLQFLSFIPWNGAGDLASTLIAFSLLWVLAQSQSLIVHFPPPLENHFPPQCRDRRQKKSKGKRISPEQFCLEMKNSVYMPSREGLRPPCILGPVQPSWTAKYTTPYSDTLKLISPAVFFNQLIHHCLG